MPQTTISTLIFDLGRVLIPFDFELGYRQLSVLSQLDTAEIRERIRATGLVPKFETGLIEAEPFVQGIGQALGVPLTVPRFAEIWNSIFLPEPLISDELLSALKQRYRLLLLSNTNQLHFEGLRENYPLLDHFEQHVLSYRVGVMKPDRAIYVHAAERAGCPPQECVFIDDLPENVEGAEAAGMAGVLFRSQGELERDLKLLGVTWS